MDKAILDQFSLAEKAKLKERFPQVSSLEKFRYEVAPIFERDVEGLPCFEGENGRVFYILDDWLNGSLARFRCKVLKGSVSRDNRRDDGTDLGTRSFQGAAL